MHTCGDNTTFNINTTVDTGEEIDLDRTLNGVECIVVIMYEAWLKQVQVTRLTQCMNITALTIAVIIK